MSHSKRNFELAEIYDDPDASVFRYGDKAVTVLANRSVCVLRPWEWLPGDDLRFPDASASMKAGLEDMLSAPEEWVATVSLGELVVWSSRRTRRSRRQPTEDNNTPMLFVTRADIDAQRVGSRVFNRRFIREAAQAFVEDWEEGDAWSTVKLSVRTLANGAALLLRHRDIDALVMCMSEQADPGDERIPTAKCECQWEPGDSPCPIHGMEEGVAAAGTSPDSVKPGMRLRSPFRDEWVVESVSVDPIDRRVVFLRNDAGEVIERPAEQVRRWKLAADFSG